MWPSLSPVFPMVPLLVDMIISLHLLWIVFLIFGFVFALKGSRIAFLHLGGLGFALLMNAMGWYCPLTYMENYLRSFYMVHSTYSTSFIARSLETLIYPDVPENLLRGGEMLLTVLYLLVYGCWAKKAGVWGRVKDRWGILKHQQIINAAP
jgi:hypothetical protein